MENKETNKIEDFGKKIGGAKKDLWRERGLMINDLEEMNEAERLKFITKDNVWKRPDYEEMVKNGLPVRVAYFIKTIRDATPTKPSFVGITLGLGIRNQQEEGYIEFVGKLRDYVMNLKTELDVTNFYQDFINQYIIRIPGVYGIRPSPSAYGCIDNKLLQASQIRTWYDIDRNIRIKEFCYTDKEKILSMFEFYQYDKQEVEFSKGYNNEDVITINGRHGKTFIYPSNNSYTNPDNWIDRTFFIMKFGDIISNNIPSLEEAKEIVIDKYGDMFNKQKSNTTKNRKKTFIPEQLQDIERDGEDYRKGKNIQGQDMIDEFEFRGGEFRKLAK